MSHAENQHWIPQFYLRRFAVPGWRDKKNAKIWVMDTVSGDSEKQKIREIAVEKFLYSHIKKDGTRCFRVEESLAELETTIARLYPRIAEGIPDLSSAWGIKKMTALFIGSLLLRHPDMEEDARHTHRRMVAHYEQLPKDANGRPAVSHIFEEGKAFEFDTSDYEDYKAADANRLKQMFADQIRPVSVKMAELLFGKRWAFLCTDQSVFFTSDKPVTMIHPEARNFGVGTPGVDLFFPICPTRMLWMSDRHDNQPDGFYPLPMSEAASLNLLTMGSATRFLLSHEPPDARMWEAGAVADAMGAQYGPPRPLAGPIWTV